MREMSYELPQNRHSLRHTSSWQDAASNTAVPVGGAAVAGVAVTAAPVNTHTHTHKHTHAHFTIQVNGYMDQDAAILRPKGFLGCQNTEGFRQLVWPGRIGVRGASPTLPNLVCASIG